MSHIATAEGSSIQMGSALVHSPQSPIAEVMKTCARIAPSDATVLLTGETGTGKEVFARYLHTLSQRSKKGFVPVNCGAIPEALLESELFGHVRGAFTGATNNRRGRVALAEGGTLFLDEIGEMPLSLQVKLLRLLQERTYEPVGSAESVTASFRLIAATNRNLAEEVEAGRFRRDLYYRLMVCPLHLPPLRDRRADVGPLFAHFWNVRGETRPVESGVMRVLEAHPWPGNVRELENLVERISVCTEGPTIRVGDLPTDLRPTGALPIELRPSVPETSREGTIELPQPVTTAPETGAMLPAMPAVVENESFVTPPLEWANNTANISLPIDLPSFLRSIEESYITAALEKAQGNKKAAADLLGLQRTTLVEKLRRRQRDVSGA